MRKISNGLHAAHSALGPDGSPLELVHRDVKSANVFVSRDGAVKVGDFGIAKASYVGRVAKTEIGQIKGTAAYMAPEHRTGEAVDRRADIYAVGAIAYELLSGTEINLDLAVLLHKGKEGWPHLPSLTSLRSDIPADLEAVVLKALSYNKADRYATCDELEEALDNVAAKFSLIGSDKAVAQFIEKELLASGRARQATPSPSHIAR